MSYLLIILAIAAAIWSWRHGFKSADDERMTAMAWLKKVEADVDFMKLLHDLKCEQFEAIEAELFRLRGIKELQDIEIEGLGVDKMYLKEQLDLCRQKRVEGDELKRLREIIRGYVHNLADTKNDIAQLQMEKSELTIKVWQHGSEQQKRRAKKAEYMRAFRAKRREGAK